MTTQAHDTVVLGGHCLAVTQLGYLPSDHPAITDFTKPLPNGLVVRLSKCSALHRGYTADWEILDDGSLHLTSLTHRFRLDSPRLFASWVSSIVSILVGEIDETRSRALEYELVREAVLELNVVKGMITKWRLVKGIGKSVRWKSGFDWPDIAATLAAHGITPDYQPSSYSHSDKFSTESLPIIARQSAELLQRAKRGDTGTGKEITEKDWDMLHRGWADPFPNLDYFDAVRTLRGHGPPLTPKEP